MAAITHGSLLSLERAEIRNRRGRGSEPFRHHVWGAQAVSSSAPQVITNGFCNHEELKRSVVGSRGLQPTTSLRNVAFK